MSAEERSKAETLIALLGPDVRAQFLAELSALSVDELDERVAQLQAEIGRLQEARRAKLASRDAASAFFKT